MKIVYIHDSCILAAAAISRAWIESMSIWSLLLLVGLAVTPLWARPRVPTWNTKHIHLCYMCFNNNNNNNCWGGREFRRFRSRRFKRSCGGQFIEVCETKYMCKIRVMWKAGKMMVMPAYPAITCKILKSLIFYNLLYKYAQPVAYMVGYINK